MRILLTGVIGVIAGYVLGALIGAGLVAGLSGNVHDKQQEIAMTAAFFTGPLGALVGLVWSLVAIWRRRARRA